LKERRRSRREPPDGDARVGDPRGGDARYRGGPLFYADTIGLRTVYDGILKYRDQFGPMHWEPAPLLAQLAAEGRSLKEWDKARN